MKHEIAGHRRRKYPLQRPGGHDLGIHLFGDLHLIDTRRASPNGSLCEPLRAEILTAGPMADFAAPF